jgi:tetratricopeptide (TPR) repeat protein
MTAAMILGCGIMASPCVAGRIAAGDSVPAVSEKTLTGQQVNLGAKSNRVALIAFLTANQRQSQQAAQDLQRVVTSIKEHELDIVIVMDDPVLADAFKNISADPNDVIYLIHDAEKELWGQFHIIAAPTVIIADESDKVASVIAGYGYDFLPSLRFHLNQVLGIAQTMTADEVGQVKTAQNQTLSDRMQRHLKMAEMLQEKGKIEASLQQLDQAQKLDPNNLQVALKIGRLYCLQNKPDLALKALEGLEFAADAEKSESELITGWAKRLSGDLESAQDHLLKATVLNPASARAFFELGQVYEAASQNDLALKAYKQALLISLDAK